MADRKHHPLKTLEHALDAFDSEMDALRRDVQDGVHDAVFDPESLLSHGRDMRLCRACDNWNCWHGDEACTRAAQDEITYGRCWCSKVAAGE